MRILLSLLVTVYRYSPHPSHSFGVSPPISPSLPPPSLPPSPPISPLFPIPFLLPFSLLLSLLFHPLFSHLLSLRLFIRVPSPSFLCSYLSLSITLCFIHLITSPLSPPSLSLPFPSLNPFYLSIATIMAVRIYPLVSPSSRVRDPVHDL